MYLWLRNDSPQAVRLTAVAVAVAVAGAGCSEFHRHVHQDDIVSMHAVSAIELVAGDELSFTPGGYHIMVFDVSLEWRQRSEYSVSLQL